MTCSMLGINEPYVFPDEVELDGKLRRMVEEDYTKFNRNGLPDDIGGYVLKKYGIGLDGRICDIRLRNPFGKASGQLSMNLNQVKDDLEAGLGFIVLKTVIAQDESGKSRMEDWKTRESRMVVERIRSKGGRIGWTVNWRGRGWSKSFEDYLDFYRASLEMGDEYEVPIMVSCMFHVPSKDEEFEVKEFEFTVSKLCGVYLEKRRKFDMLMEVDFSPTLNLLDDVKDPENVRRWFDEIPKLIRNYGISRMKVGAKIFNVVGDDEYQKEIARMALTSDFDFLTFFNRLFDPVKKMAYGGYDLSDRNLRVMDELRDEIANYISSQRTISGTGNIDSGRMMLEYAVRGCSSGQIHTFFQIPLRFYGMMRGSRTERALNELIFNPKKGLIPFMIHEGFGRFTDIVENLKRGENDAGERDHR
ncbi:MAG: hypothetical protein J7L28_03295 [Thermotogae bacterium]|nr:hypothetical protein [Thermotogota bacterium]